MCACNYTGNVPPAAVENGTHNTSKPLNQSEELCTLVKDIHT